MRTSAVYATAYYVSQALLQNRKAEAGGIARAPWATALDYAHAHKDLSDIHFPDVEQIARLRDSLNTHKPALLYEAFPPAEARRLLERFEQL